jgi:hypothetical protein
MSKNYFILPCSRYFILQIYEIPETYAMFLFIDWEPIVQISEWVTN